MPVQSAVILTYILVVQDKAMMRFNIYLEINISRCTRNSRTFFPWDQIMEIAVGFTPKAAQTIYQFHRKDFLKI